MSFDAFAANGGAPQPSSTPAAPETSSAPPAASTTVTGSQETSAPPASTGEIKGTKPNSVALDPTGKATVTPELPAFTPEFKFKVMDKEHEIPENFRSLIKDADTQKQVREVFEKALGLDVVKPRMKEYQTQLGEMKPKLQAFENGVSELRNFVAKDDFDSFLKYLQIPEEKMLQWAVKKAQYMELPPEQRQVQDARRAAEERVYQLEKQVTDFQTQTVEQKNTAKISDLRTELNKPDITAFAKSYDQRMGQDGKFIEAVIEVGKAAYFGSQGKVDLTAAEAIQKVLALAGGMPTQALGAAPVIPQQGNPGGANPAAALPPVKKPSLPNLASKNATAVSKPKFTSLAEIKKHAASFKG